MLGLRTAAGALGGAVGAIGGALAAPFRRGRDSRLRATTVSHGTAASAAAGQTFSARHIFVNALQLLSSLLSALNSPDTQKTPMTQAEVEDLVLKLNEIEVRQRYDGGAGDGPHCKCASSSETRTPVLSFSAAAAAGLPAEP